MNESPKPVLAASPTPMMHWMQRLYRTQILVGVGLLKNSFNARKSLNNREACFTLLG